MLFTFGCEGEAEPLPVGLPVPFREWIEAGCALLASVGPAAAWVWGGHGMKVLILPETGSVTSSEKWLGGINSESTVLSKSALVYVLGFGILLLGFGVEAKGWDHGLRIEDHKH